jgi:hypothetical protein
LIWLGYGREEHTGFLHRKIINSWGGIQPGNTTKRRRHSRE